MDYGTFIPTCEDDLLGATHAIRQSRTQTAWLSPTFAHSLYLSVCRHADHIKVTSHHHSEPKIPACVFLWSGVKCSCNQSAFWIKSGGNTFLEQHNAISDSIIIVFVPIELPRSELDSDLNSDNKVLPLNQSYDVFVLNNKRLPVRQETRRIPACIFSTIEYSNDPGLMDQNLSALLYPSNQN